MVGYKTAPADVEVSIEEKMEVLEEKKSSTGWMWKAQTAEQKAPIPKDSAGTTDPHYMLKQFSGNAKAAIHLVGTYEEDESSDLEWSDNTGQAFTYGNFKLVENQIVIPHSGLYFVYSQASFRVSCADEAGAREPPAHPSHRIWRFSDSIGSEVSLMSAVRSVCQHGVQDDDVGGGIGWYNTIYLGAVFQLNKGDKLWTATNPLSELETDEGKTFFGVFAL
ncbi:tumor necrosis factor b (TNF superfamily, member 2) [Xenentodon cancila]